MRCRICKHATFEFLLCVTDLRYHTSDIPFDVLRCAQCGVFATTRDGDFFDPRESYPPDYGAFVQKKAGKPRPWKGLRIAERLRNLLQNSTIASDRFAWTTKLDLKRGTKVLDVGCGTGKTSRWLMSNFGCDVTGIEPHLPTAGIAADNGLQVHGGTLADFESEETFDVVLLIHVLEHLEDPLESLRQVHRLLQAGGHLVVALPNAGSLERRLFGAFWDGWDIPRHVHHFNPSSLSYLLQASDFAHHRMAYEWYSLFSRSLANRLHPNLTHHQRAGKYRSVPVEASWGLLQSSLRTSSALQVIAVRGDSSP
jgi:SAM-dependent methyltransferase